MDQNQKISPLKLDEVKEILGPKTWDTALKMADILRKYLNGGNKFTGKVVFTVNCRQGGIGNTEAFVQKKID
jgi:hypothetical protein